MCGLMQDGVGYVKGQPLIKLHMEAYLGAPESYDAVRIAGNPPLAMKIAGGVHGDIATASITVNSIPKMLQRASPACARCATWRCRASGLGVNRRITRRHGEPWEGGTRTATVPRGVVHGIRAVDR